MACSKKVEDQLSKGRPFGSRSFEPRSATAFGEVVRALRLEAGVSQEDLAHRLNLERAHVGRIERGENQPTLWVILKLAEGLGVMPGVLMDRTVAQMPGPGEPSGPG